MVCLDAFYEGETHTHNNYTSKNPFTLFPILLSFSFKCHHMHPWHRAMEWDLAPVWRRLRSKILPSFCCSYRKWTQDCSLFWQRQRVIRIASTLQNQCQSWWRIPEDQCIASYFLLSLLSHKMNCTDFYSLSAKAAHKSIAQLKSVVEVSQVPRERICPWALISFVLLLGDRVSKLLWN